ncbi:MAG: hypothetical protein ACM30G_21715 [Micromonosporaceae bacterium]
MNRRTFDVLMPFVYVIAITFTWLVSQNPTWVGGVTTIGALLLGAYYAALRQNLPAGPKS